MFRYKNENGILTKKKYGIFKQKNKISLSTECTKRVLTIK